MLRDAFLIIACSIFPWSAMAADISEKIVEDTYLVRGLTPDALKAEMQRKGPKGYWGYARWRIQWTGDCEVSLTLTYTLPRHMRVNQMSPENQVKWKAMWAALRGHEETHGQHGRNAAAEIKAANCKNARKIIRKWSAEDQKYDKETKHGRLEGVVLD